MSSQMNTFVKLGSNKDLSKMELSVVFEKLSVTNLKFFEWKDYLFLSLSKTYQKKLLQSLDSTGSIVKVGSLFSESSFSDEIKLREEVSYNIRSVIEEKIGKKIKFSLNIQSRSIEERGNISRIIKQEIKKLSKPKHIDVKTIPTKKDSMELSPFQYYKENIQKRGKEINCFAIKSKIFVGFTTWVTNPFRDIKQDEERPIRFFTHGTSIKLARTLVNLSNTPENGFLLDPFCGTGTILIEGLKQGIKVIGVDKDPKCVRASKANLNHFANLHPSKMKMKERWSIYLHDSRFLSNVIKLKVDSLATEPYLGPFLKNLPPIDHGKEIMENLEKLYIRVLSESSNHIKEGGRVLIIMPEYHYPSNKIISPDFDKICVKSSLKQITESKFFGVKTPVDVGRAHNIINRKLLIFEK